MSRNLLPNFLCIGSQKAGTSWVYEMLKQNSDIWLPDIKEVHYFDFLFGERTGTRHWGGQHAENAVNRLNRQAKTVNQKEYVKAIAEEESFTENWYRKIFSHNGAQRTKIRGEVTPEYCAISESGVKHVACFLGNPKILWVVRDPYERAISQVKMVVNRSWKTPPSSDNDWRKALNRVRYSNRANYQQYIPIWDHVFGDRIMYAAYGDIKRRPSGLLEDIESFLGVVNGNYSGESDVVHKTKKLDLPEWVKEEVYDTVSCQYGFLTNRFGKDFVEATV